MEKKHTAQFKYVVKSVLLSFITVPAWSYAKHFVFLSPSLKNVYLIRVSYFNHAENLLKIW